MAASEHEIDVSTVLIQKLKSIFLQSPDEETVGIISGWYSGNQIVCVACAESEEYITAGLQIVGAFYCSRSSDVTEREVIEKCESTLVQTISEEHAVLFCLSGDVPSEAKTDIYLYSLHYNTTTRPAVVYKEEMELYSDCVIVRSTGNMSVAFEFDSNEEITRSNIEERFGKIKYHLENGAAAFLLKDTSILLSKSSEEESETVQSMVKKYEENQQVDGKNRAKKKKRFIKEKAPLHFELLVKVTGEDNTEHTPVIHYQRRDLKAVRVPVSIDVITLIRMADTATELQLMITRAISQQMDQVARFLIRFHEKTFFHTPSIYHFWPNCCGHPLTVVLPKNLDDEHLAGYRMELHQKLYLPRDKPLLRKGSRFMFVDELPNDGYLRNTHIGLVSTGSGSQVATVDGNYTYHHYMQDRMDDSGWGCAYRSLQTIVSWFKYQGYTGAAIPTHKEIQKALVDVGDKPAAFVGSKQWIGSQEVSICLNQLIGVTSKIMFVSSGAELPTKGRELLNHFQTNGTPIMIGGGVLAHTILGVDYNENTGDIKFLILDPHYTGAEDLQVIQNKGWCGWKGPDFWEKNAFYNLCLPQRPQIV